MESMSLEIAVREREMDRRLLEVAINGNTMELHQLLQEDSHILDREMSKCEKERKDNPLHIAALYGHVDFIREISSRKWDFTRQLNSQGQSPLHLATARGQVEVVKEILNADPGACFVRDRDGMIPLHVAAINGRHDVLKVLVEANKTTAFVFTERGEPILHLCAKNNQIEALRKLVDFVDNRDFVNLKDNDDNSILHILSAKSQTRAIRFLFKKGVLDHANADNRAGLTPADVLIVSGSVFGLSGFIIMMLLLYAGVWPKRIIIGLPIEVELARLDGSGTAGTGTSTDASWFVEVLLVVAVLTITVAFQTGINPPGGFWQSTEDDNGAMHYAGKSVMSSMDPKRYRDFSNLTNLTVSTSVCAIIMLICRWHSNSFSWINKFGPVLLTSISICTMVAAYDVALSFLSLADEYLAYKRWLRYGSVCILLALIFLMANIAELHRLSCFVMVWSLEKFKQVLGSLKESLEVLRMLGSGRMPQRDF